MCRRFYNKDQVVRTSEDYSSLKKTRRLTCRIERFSGSGLRAPLLWPALQLSWPHPVHSRPESPGSLCAIAGQNCGGEGKESVICYLFSSV